MTAKQEYESYQTILREAYPTRKYNYPFSQKSYENLKKQVEKLEARKKKPAKESQGVRQGKIVSLKAYLKSLSLTLFMLTQEPYNYTWLNDTNFRNIKNEQLNRLLPILEDRQPIETPTTTNDKKKTSKKKTSKKKTSKSDFADIIFIDDEERSALEDSTPEIIFIENEDIWIEGHLDVKITMKRETGKPFEVNYKDIIGKVYKLKNGKKLRYNGKILTKDLLEAYIYESIENRIDNYAEGTGYEIQYENKKITFIPKKRHVRLLQNIKMKNQIYRYSKMNDYSYNNNKCVIDTFYNMFHDIYKSINYPLLEEQFQSVMSEGSRLEDGITCIDIENFLKKYYKFVSMYAVDPLGNCFYKYKPVDCRHSLVFRLNGEHIYPIEDTKEKHIVERGGSLLSRYKYNLDINEKNYTYFDIATECEGLTRKEIFSNLYDELSLNEVDDKLNFKKYLIVSGIDNLLEFSVYFIKRSQYYIDYYKFEEGILVSFVHPQSERIILINNDYEQCMDVVNLLSERIEGYSFSNQSLATLSSIWFESFNPKLKKSEFNTDTLETINIHAKAPLVEQEEESNISNRDYAFKAYDINKSYTHALLSETEEYPIYSVFDTFERFNPQTDDIKPGEYLLNESTHDSISIWFKSRKCNFNPFNGKLLYNANLIKFMLSVKMISKYDIFKYLEPSYTINKDTFKSYVNDVYTSGLEDKICKKLINNFVGVLGRKMSTVTKSCITDNVEIKDFYYDRNCVVDTIYEQESEDINDDIGDIFIIKDETKYRLIQDNIGIYNTIIDRGIINILTLFLEIFKTGNVIKFISFQTDYIAYEFKTLLEEQLLLGDGIGQYKIDKYKLLKRAKKREEEVTPKELPVQKKTNRFINKENKLNEISFIKSELEEMKNETEENYISLKYSDYETELKNKLIKMDRFGLHVNKQQLKLNCKIYLGGAGYGKTYRLCNEMIVTIAEPSTKIICLNPTAASRENVNDIIFLLTKNLPTFTVLDFDQFFISAISTVSKVNLLDGYTHLFIDEVFMVSKYFITLVQFVNREYPNIKIICAGDHEQCLAPQIGSFDYYFNNGFMKLFGEVVQLEYIKDCARYDEVLKNVLDTMRMDEQGNYNYKIEDILTKFPITNTIKSADINYNSTFICKKNATKRMIDKLCMDTIIKKYNLSYKTLKYEGKEIQKQDINVFVGMKIICRVNNKHTKDVETKKVVPTFNSQVFTVTEIKEDTIILNNNTNATLASISIDFVNFMKYFEMSYANTVYRWQGKSINQHFTILDTLTKREAYVALSRSTKYEYINLHSSFNISDSTEKRKEIINITDKCFIGYIYIKNNKIYKHTAEIGSKIEFENLVQRNYYTCEQDFTNDFQRLMKEHKKKIENKHEKVVSMFELSLAINIHKLKLNDIKDEKSNNRLVLVYRIDNRGYRKSIRYNKVGYDQAMKEMNEFITSLKNEYE